MRPLSLTTSNWCILVKNTVSWVAVVFCVCFLIPLFSVELYLVTAVHEFNFKLVISWTPHKWQIVNKELAICSTPREVINHQNQLCKQKAVKKILILPTCHADKRTAKDCGVSLRTLNARIRVKREIKETLCTPQERDSKTLRNLNHWKSWFVCGWRKCHKLLCWKENCSNCRKCLPIITENKFSLREQSFRWKYGIKFVVDGKNVKAKKNFNTATLFCWVALQLVA